MQNTAYDTALESLLTASAALDSLDLDRGSHLVLKIASLVIEAKKADKKKKDEKKKPSPKKKVDKSDKKKVSKSATEFLSYEKTATNILTYKTAQITPNTYSYWSPKSLADNAKSGNINLDDLHRSGKITNEQYDQAYQLVNGVAAPGAAKQPKKIELPHSELHPVGPEAPLPTNVDKVIGGKKYHIGPDGKWTLSPAQSAPITEMHGFNVKRIQDALASKGIPIGRWGADGRWGPDTQNALNDFKKRLNVPGVTDKQALLWLMSGSMPAQTPYKR
jgi:hypothetical protein